MDGLESPWRGSSINGPRRLTLTVLAATLATGLTAVAATEPDRLYNFGEIDFSQTGTIFDTFDGVFVDGVTFVDAQDLTAGGSSPTYISLGGGGLNDPLPGGVTSTVAASFDGADFLTGAALNNPSTTVSNTDSNSPILGNYDDLLGRGYQFWARPADAGGGSPATGSDQTLINDGERHSVLIDAGGFWRARYNNTFRTSTVAAAADTWTHLMLVSPTGTTGATFYVNGLAAVGFTGGYSGGTNDLFVGARSDTTEFYTGVIDEVDMFVLGDNGTVSAEFNYATDNEYFTEVFLPTQSAAYSGGAPWVVGDADFDGDVDTDDVNTFVANWLGTNTVTGGVQAGDYTSMMLGDFDVDGDVDRQDFFLLREANPSAVATVFGTPEPTTLWLLAAVGVGFVATRRGAPRALAAVACLAVATLATPGEAQTITWDDGGDMVSLYQEANWTGIDDIAGTDPPDNTINAATEALVNLTIGGAATAGGPTGAGGTLQIADSLTITVQDDAFLRFQGSAGIQNADPAVNANLNLRNNGAVFTQFLSNITADLDDASTLTLFGAGDPVGENVVIDLASDWTGSLTFNNENPTAVVSEHLSQITVGGAPAVFGTNVDLVSNGGAGSVLTLGTSPSLPTLTIDRDNGRMLLENNTGSSLGTIVQYDVQSADGGFAPGDWDSIADTGGFEGDGTPIGATGWFEFTAPGAVSADLSEGTLGAGLDFVDGLSLDFGDGSWITSPFEDVRLVLQDDLGNDIEAVVFYTGTQVTEGDFNGDGVIDQIDWPTVRDNLLTDVSALSPLERYLSGDLNNDGAVDRLDFNEFKTLFEAQASGVSFAEMVALAAVPEPGGAALGSMALLGLIATRRRRKNASPEPAVCGRRTTSTERDNMHAKTWGTRAAACLLVACAATASDAQIITWDGGGDMVSTFQEANWVVTDDTGSAALAGLVGMDPPADFVNPSTDIEANVIVGGMATAGGANGSPNVDLGESFSLTVQDDATLNARIGFSPFGGIRGVSGGVAETLTVQDNGTLIAQFLLDIEASFSGSADVTFGGFGVGTLNNSTVDLASDWTGSITWPNFAGVSGSTIIDNITVDGLPAIEGDNIDVFSDGTQSILTIDNGLPDPASLSLVVDPISGLARIDGADSDVAIDYYEISSEGSFLNTGDWISLQDQGIDGNTVDDGFGWEEAGGSGPSAVAEALLTGESGSSTTVAASSGFAFLGALFDGGAAVTSDLTFTYQSGGVLFDGNVISGSVTAPAGVAGDYNNDGAVDAADYAIWRENEGTATTLSNDPTPGTVTQTDYDVWRANFGAVFGGSSATVPEPSATLLLLSGVAAVGLRRKR